MGNYLNVIFNQFFSNITIKYNLHEENVNDKMYYKKLKQKNEQNIKLMLARNKL